METDNLNLPWYPYFNTLSEVYCFNDKEGNKTTIEIQDETILDYVHEAVNSHASLVERVRELEGQLETQRKSAYILAMRALQSGVYHNQSDLKESVDEVLDWSALQKKEGK